MDHLLYLATVLAATHTPTPESTEAVSNTASPWAGAVWGVLATLAGVVVTALISRRNEHAKWIREERLQAYLASFHLAGTLEVEIRRYKSIATAQVTLDVLEKFTSSAAVVNSTLRLLGPKIVSDASDEFHVAILAWGKKQAALVGERALSDSTRKLTEGAESSKEPLPTNDKLPAVRRTREEFVRVSQIELGITKVTLIERIQQLFSRLSRLSRSGLIRWRARGRGALQSRDLPTTPSTSE
jgi:hypothetical protein